MQQNPNGFHQKYHIQKIDGKPLDENSEYFVLRLDKNGEDSKHGEACRVAIISYAESIKDYLPQLSKDLLCRYGK